MNLSARQLLTKNRDAAKFIIFNTADLLPHYWKMEYGFPIASYFLQQIAV